ncbi:MAG: hypothetical protein U5K55_01025 [Aliarcobacter sp.]|nr:hypothetical protein [Aliarcobacter sp.]
MPIPKVKTGPTAGQERSRNNDGAWRRKRSDAGTTREKDDYSSSENSNTLQNIVSIVTNTGMVVGEIVKFIRRFKK